MHRSDVAVPGGTLNVVDEGEGPPILLLHAGVADLRAWDDVVPHLTRAGHRVIRYDIRGLGRSITEDVEFSHRADLRAVLHAVGVERAVLVGNSKGGQIAIDNNQCLVEKGYGQFIKINKVCQESSNPV